MKKHLFIAVSLLLSGWFDISSAAESGKFPSLTDVGPYETPSRYASTTITYNLGPIGARGWVRAYDGGKLFWGENGWEILVTHVAPGSPADGKLEVFDVIVGAAGKTFDQDARKCLGNAIAKAQRGDGRLTLRYWRQGTISDVTLQLPRLPGDSVNAPIVAEDSAALRRQFLDFVATSMHPDGFKMHPVYASLNALYLLANGKPEHLDLVRRHIRTITDDIDPKSEYGPWNWVKGSNVTLLAEYYLKTGDSSVLPAIKQNLIWMRNSQSYAGGFGHGGPYGGYGHVGHPGMFNTIGAVLARECGVTGFDDMIDQAQRFYARGAGLGKIGYGGFDANTGLKTLYGDNGKSGTAAILYSCLGNETISRAYANTAGALAAYSESGHSGHFWSFSWGAVGANLGELSYRKHFAKELDWYYALSRTWRGGMTSQPWLGNTNSYAPGGAEIATGGMALWYCTPLKSLRILGGEKSILSKELPKPLADARQLIHDKKYRDCIAALEKRTPGDAEERKQAAALQAIAEKALTSIDLTRTAIRTNIDKGDLYLAERQLHALKPILVDPAAIQEYETILNTEKSQAVIESGKTYYDAMQYRGSPDREFFYRAPAIVLNTKQRKAMQAIAESEASGSYARMAAAALKRYPAAPARPEYQTLVETEVTPVGPYPMYVGRDPDAKPGVRYQYLEFDTIPTDPQAIRAMKPVAEGTVKSFTLKPRKRKTNFGFRFRSFVEIKETGEYTFTSTSDDGSYLFVNGKQVIDNGGLHGMISKSATVNLAPGRHEVECVMFQGKGGFGLRVDMTTKTELPASETRDIPFEIADPTDLKKLKVSVKATTPAAVYLNGEVICRFHKKRSKHIFDSSWKEWEALTLRPEVLTLLKKGKNVLGVAARSSELSPEGAPIGVKLLGDGPPKKAEK